MTNATIADYPDEYIEELEVITGDSLGGSMQGTFYFLAGTVGICLLTSIFLPKKMLLSTTDDET